MKWWRRYRARVEEERGQAMVEYASITFVLLSVGIFGFPIWIALLHAVQIYFDSFFLVIRLPFP